MKIVVIEEAGLSEALQGISLSFNSDVERMPARAERLAPMGKGHNKFLESICVWIDIDAPRYWWSQFDTYRIGVTKQSESTMHTLTKRELRQDDFEIPVHPAVLNVVNEYIRNGDLINAKANLPEAFLQRRIVCTNYKALRGMVEQRSTHKLPEWQYFIESLLKQLARPEYINLKGE